MPADKSNERQGTNALIAAIFASGMAFIDGTVVNVATAKLQVIFAATTGEVQWVVEAYALTLSALLLVGGVLGDRYGQKRVFIYGNVLFGVSSLLCGVAHSLVGLVLARAVQGVAAAAMIPGSLALITAAYPPSKRGRAIGIWSGATAMMSAIGPFFGGWLIDNVSWRAVFFINLPMAVVAVFFASRLQDSSGTQSRPTPNWAGAASMVAALAALTYALLSAQGSGAYAIPSAIACVVLLAMFVVFERRSAAPLLPVVLLKSPVFVGVNAITLFLYGAMYGSMYFFPLCLIQIHHYTASQAGAAIAPLILTLFALSPWTGKLLTLYGARASLTVGCCVVAAALASMAIPGADGGYWSTFFAPVLGLGLGLSVCVAPLTTTVMGSAPDSELGVASGINNAVSRVAGLVAIAAFGFVLTASFDARLDHALAPLRLNDSARAEIDRQKPLLASAQYADPSIQHAIDTSFVDAFRIVMGTAAVLALIGAACSWRMLKETRENEA
ncbi:DHA2 family efflux MFS transporter permease subunit [Pararobbsia alpina]|uniref:MFS transporter n=1 Tax=Pararobbsia alpina TaxID=621374 RepID=UPI0039A6351E